MTNITFAPGVPNSFVNFYNLMDVLSQQANVTTFTPLEVFASSGTTQFTIRGTALSVQVSPGGSDLISGAVDSITIRENGVDTISLTAAGLSAAAMYAATLAEEATPGSAALETFLGNLGYIYNGTSGADVLLSTARSSDNVLINLRGADLVNLGAGNDNFFLGSGNDTGNGGDGNDTLLGHTGNDSLNGGAGNDSLNGSIGNDSLNGGRNNDLLRGGDGNDVLLGSSGNDRLFGEAGNDRQTGGSGNDQLTGGSGNDQLTGGTGNDQLIGGSGNDLLVGEAGRDRLTAGLGRDTMTGSLANGIERDDFIFASAAEMGTGANRDRITDFDSGVDRINLAALSLDAFIGGRAFSGTQAEARFVVSSGNGFLQVDADGNGTLDASLLLVGVTSLQASDLLL